MKHILLLEDDENINRGISLKLGKEGYCECRTELHSVRTEAGNLGKLQTESGEKAQMVAASSDDTVEHSKQVLQMVKQMQALLENTLGQVNEIFR